MNPFEKARDEDAQWPGVVWSTWFPLIGPRYCALLASARVGLFFGGGAFLLGLVVIIVLAALPFLSAVMYYSIVAAVVVIVVVVFMYFLARFTAVGKRIRGDLRASGHSIASAPDLRAASRFAAWCAREGVTVEDILEAGRTRYRG